VSPADQQAPPPVFPPVPCASTSPSLPSLPSPSRRRRSTSGGSRVRTHRMHVCVRPDVCAAVYDVGGDCQDAHYTTLPLDVAQTTKTVTTTLPLTTTISVYPGFRRAATAEPVITAAPLAERDSGTIVHSWVRRRAAAGRERACSPLYCRSARRPTPRRSRTTPRSPSRGARRHRRRPLTLPLPRILCVLVTTSASADMCLLLVYTRTSYRDYSFIANVSPDEVFCSRH
jgi:hypothetical protein